MVDIRKIKHKINIKRDRTGCNVCGKYKRLIKRAVRIALRNEAVDKLCVVNVLITDDEGIREYNHKYREIDKATDVLSFPMQNFINAGWEGLNEPEFDEDTGDLPLGDIIISAETSKRQANKYGNTVEYETTYLIIHSTLHLLGYDHGDESSEKDMHEKSKQIMQKMGFEINDK